MLSGQFPSTFSCYHFLLRKSNFFLHLMQVLQMEEFRGALSPKNEVQRKSPIEASNTSVTFKAGKDPKWLSNNTNFSWLHEAYFRKIKNKINLVWPIRNGSIKSKSLTKTLLWMTTPIGRFVKQKSNVMIFWYSLHILQPYNGQNP